MGHKNSDLIIEGVMKHELSLFNESYDDFIVYEFNELMSRHLFVLKSNIINSLK